MKDNRSQFYFTIAILAILAAGSFAILGTMNMTIEFTLMENSFYGVIRNEDVRLTADISNNANNIESDVIKNGFDDIDFEIDKL